MAQECSRITDQEIEQLVDELPFLDLNNDSILLNPKLPYIALEALRKGFLDPLHGQKQAATLLNFWAALQYHQGPTDLLIRSVFEEEELLRASFEHSNNPTLKPFLHDEDKFDLFLDKMRALPRSEQYFLDAVKIQGDDPLPIISEKNNGNFFKATISQATKATGINVFNRLENDVQIIPSVGMMQAFLEAQYGEDAVEIKPRVYHSTFQHIYDTRLNDTCDMMMPSPDAEGKNRCPSTADGYPAPWYTFPGHDFYHSIQTSAIGKIYRRAGALASNTIRAYAKTAPSQDQKGLDQIADRLVDMDFPPFQHFFEKPPTHTQASTFWISMSQQFSLQKMKFKIHEALKARGVTPPHEADLISDESELGAFFALYHVFVEEKQGTSELNEKSFEAAALYYKPQIPKEEICDTPILRLGKKLGVTGL